VSFAPIFFAGGRVTQLIISPLGEWLGARQRR
jgi:hypothetical protein